MTCAVYENVVALGDIGAALFVFLLCFPQNVMSYAYPIIVSFPGSQLATDIQTAEEEYATITSGCANDSEFDETYVLKNPGHSWCLWGNGCGFLWLLWRVLELVRAVWEDY